MTNTTLQTIQISSIIVDDRVRKKFDQKQLDALADSLRTSGVIHPIVLDDSMHLVAGERRLRAAQLLGWSTIPATIRTGLTDWDRQVIELEENIRREALTYVEELEALERLHTLYQTKHGTPQDGKPGGWKVKDTADLLGISAGATSQDLQLARAIKNDPELAQQKTKIAAKAMMERKQEIKARQVMAMLNKPETAPMNDQQLKPTKAPIHLSLTNCLDGISSLPPESISCLLTDPPWNVEFDENFNNSPQDAFSLTRDMLTALKPKLQPDALCWLFCATKHVISGELYNLILDCGYHLLPQLFIWYKPSTAHSSHPYKELKNDYEPAMVFSPSTARPFTKPTFAVYATNIKHRRIHPAEKPIDMLQHLIEISTVKHELILDPFAGSASTLVAAALTDRRCIGFELERQWFDIGLLNMREQLPQGDFSYDPV